MVVGPEGSETVFVPVDENSSYSIDVIALGSHVPGSPVNGTRDCRSPEPSAALDDECATSRTAEGISITLTPKSGGTALAAGTVPDDAITWACAVSDATDNKYVPANCRI